MAAGEWAEVSAGVPPSDTGPCLVYCSDDEYRIATYERGTREFSEMDFDRYPAHWCVVRWAQIVGT